MAGRSVAAALLLTDLTGNTHRSEFSIDKLYSPDSATGRLGLLEFRAFEMPPHAQMSAMQMVLLRALVARFWREPYRGELVRWGTALHDRWMLPHFIAADIRGVADGADPAFGYAFAKEWFDPFIGVPFSARFGTVDYDGVTIELRQAIEPWHVLGEEVSGTGTARYVDSSVERLQVKVSGMTAGRHVVTCGNGRGSTAAHADRGRARVRRRRCASRAWSPPSALHPAIGVHAPVDLRPGFDVWAGRAIGGCTYPRRSSGRTQLLRHVSRSMPTKPRRVALRASGRTATARDRWQ